jgi:hypothetical protein
MKIYLGGPMFTEAEVIYNLQLAQQIRSKGIEVYCPNENASINDKTRSDITGERIYLADIAEIESSNVFVCQIAEDSGTMWEAGYMDCLARKVDPTRYLGCIGLATDIRLATLPNPQQYGYDNQCGYLNQFIVGGLKLSLGICITRDELLTKLSYLKSKVTPQ